MNTIVRCPTCARVVEWSEGSPWRPFCSERCKLIDLGGWLTEKNTIPGEAAEIPDAENEGVRPLQPPIRNN